MTLRARLEAYYAVHDPSKLDNDGITPICAWVEQHGEELLRERMEAKYGAPLPEESEEAVVEEEERWQEVRSALAAFYEKLGVSKTPDEMEVLMAWVKKRGLSSLQHQLTIKYDQALHPELIPSWSILFEVGKQKDIEEEDISQLLLDFFQKHDPEKPKDDIEFLAGYAQRHGVGPVNEQLRLNFGLGLEDVCAFQPPSIPDRPDMDKFSSSRAQAEKKNLPSNGGTKGSAAPDAPQSAAAPETDAALDKRKQHITALLERYYIKASPDMLQMGNKDKFDAIVKYGLQKGLKKLNLALHDKYGTDLDDLQRQDLRASVAGFLNQQMGVVATDPWSDDATSMKDVDHVVEFGLDNGMLMLDEALERQYGQNLAGEEAI